MRRTGPTKATVAGVMARDDNRCTRCGGVEWLECHHRRPRALGGTSRPESNSPVNLLTLCRGCHAHVESHRREARATGWLVDQTADPAEVPLLLDVTDEPEWVYLTEDYQYRPASPVGAA